MSLLETAQLLASGGPPGTVGLRLPREAVAELAAGEVGGSVDRLMLSLIPLARRLAQPRLSGFAVGAVALGSSGALYFGANIEPDAASVSATVHAEQSAVTLAILNGETGVERLAVSAPPCGYCRQFLWELETAERLRILLADRPPTPLADLLPCAFGPADLGVRGGLGSTDHIELEWVKNVRGPAIEAALAAARGSYAPYTGAVAGIGLIVRPEAAPGRPSVLAGPYLENAAFNPSLSPLQTALIALAASSLGPSDIAGAALVQRHDSKVDHSASARGLLARLAPGVRLRIGTVRPADHPSQGARTR